MKPLDSRISARGMIEKLPALIFMRWEGSHGQGFETSLLNKWNQLHSCQNVFVTDGAA